MGWRSLEELLTDVPAVVGREGTLQDGRRHGRWEATRADGSVAVRADYVRGVRHGSWTRWHPDGRPAVQVTYAGGLAHGLLLAWYADGRLALRAELRRGRLHGPFAATGRDGERIEGSCRAGEVASVGRPPRRLRAAAGPAGVRA
jgi:hypothetical protein